MRVRHMVLAAVAALATVAPARADFFLSYALSAFVPPNNGSFGSVAFPTAIPDGDPANYGTQAIGAPISSGTLGTGLIMTLGSTKYLQVIMRTNASAPTQFGTSINQSAWTGGNRLIGSGIVFNYPTSIVSQPIMTPVQDFDFENGEFSAAYAPLGIGHPQTFNGGYNMGHNAMAGSASAGGINAIAGNIFNASDGNGQYIAFTMKIIATNVGTGVASVTQLTPNLFGMSTAGQSLDDLIFGPNPLTFPNHDYNLNITVLPVPEPSSMALVGLAVAGFGWRKLRRKTPVAA